MHPLWWWEVNFCCVMVLSSVVDSNGFSRFSGNLLSLLVCYLELKDIGSGMFVGMLFMYTTLVT